MRSVDVCVCVCVYTVLACAMHGADACLPCDGVCVHCDGVHTHADEAACQQEWYNSIIHQANVLTLISVLIQYTVYVL